MRYRIVAALVAGGLVLAGCGGPMIREAGPITASPGAGASASAGAPAQAAGRAPSRSFDVAERTDTYARDATRMLRTTTWYPDGNGPFPLIVFSHGLGGLPTDYRSMLSAWAAAGFVVVAPAYPKTSRGVAQIDVGDVLNQPGDASHVLTQVLAGPLGSRIDKTRIGAAGHSAGAITTVGLFTIGRDERLSAGILFAGAGIGVGTNFLGPAARLLFVHGEDDNVVTFASGKAVFDAAPWPKAWLSLPGQGHSAPFTRESNAAYRAVEASTVDFLRYALYGDATARGRLAADAKPAGRLDDRL